MAGRWLLAFLLTISATEPRVSATLTPMVVRAGGSVRVTCRVPRDADNRGLEIALVPVQSSFRQLDGAESAITWSLFFEHVPCWAESALCIVHSVGNRDAIARRPLEVVGCNE